MPGIIKIALFTLTSSFLTPFLISRYHALSTIGLFPLSPINTFTSQTILFRPLLRNCEDVFYHPSLHYALLSCDPGRDNWNTVMGTFRPHDSLPNGQIWLFTDVHSTASALGPLEMVDFPHENDFHPLGMDLEVETGILYVVSHAQRGSCVEVFTVDVEARKLVYRQTIRHDLLQAPNSIVAVGGGRLFVTNDHMLRARKWPMLSKVETFSGLPGGSVVFLETGDLQGGKVVARVPFANGITALNETTLAVASSSKPGVYLFDIQADDELEFKHLVRTKAAVDNLSVDSKGTLLLAGHPSAIELMKVSKGRPLCNLESEVEAEREACECRAPSWVAEWTERGGLRTLYQGYDFCSSTMMVRDVEKGWGMVTGLYERGVMIVKEGDGV